MLILYNELQSFTHLNFENNGMELSKRFSFILHFIIHAFLFNLVFRIFFKDDFNETVCTIENWEQRRM